jgi:LPXTG-motif cell wall-anchored protein
MWGILCILLGVLLLTPMTMAAVFIACGGVIGFDPATRNGGIAISLLGLVIVMAGIALTIRRRRNLV